MTIGEMLDKAYGPETGADVLKRAAARMDVTASKIKINVTTVDNTVKLELSEECDFVLMTAKGARLLASKLVLMAEELEQGNSNG